MQPPQEVPLTFTVAFSTPHSGRYSAEHILVDCPTDQNSRWSGAFQGTTKQWLLLRLETIAVLRRITFGKFNKPHPCNMKEFKVYIGLTEDNMVEVLHSGLKNNTEPETFEIKHINGSGITIPTRYVKIEPIASHGPSFHTSIWYVAMTGHADREYIEQVQTTYEEQREQTILRHILKHLRQRRLLTPFKAVTERSGLRLEHPLVTKLHETLVLQGDWKKAEDLLVTLSENGLFTNYLNSCQPLAFWTRLTGTDADGDVPSPRGGHAMCMDPEKEIVYLFGGWDGQKSLDDFWSYDIKEDRWKLLCASTSKEPNAPGARSCHKMVFDPKTGNIYLLGRLDDSDARPMSTRGGAPAPPPAPSPLRQWGAEAENETGPPANFYCSEFYRYQTRGLDAGKWVFLSFDTASSGGPPLMFDHQMVLDSESQMLYVFGGRVVDGDWTTSKYAGLYSYNIRKSKWRLLQAPDPSGTLPNTIPPRFGHSMVLEPKAKQLYIFGGQREQRYLSDMYVYDLNTGISKELYSNFSMAGGPDPGFTQRSVIDPLLKEIYVFCGLTRTPTANTTPQASSTLNSHSTSWIYRYDSSTWSQISRHPENLSTEGPIPRFAHQVVYHPSARTVYMHGGNAGPGDAAGVTHVVVAGPNTPVPVGMPPLPPLLMTLADAQEQQIQYQGQQAQIQQSGQVNRPRIVTGSSSEGTASDPPAVPPTSTVAEKRLDDFWKLELRRPGVEEVMRKAKFHIRQQQFREMCEEIPSVQALQFLQTQVSSVVDHKDSDETEAFRSLLSHLLQVPSKRPPTRSTGKQTQPRQANTVDGSDSEDGWTNQLPGEDEEEEAGSEIDFASSTSGSRRGTAGILRGIIDPLEFVVSFTGAKAPGPNDVSNSRDDVGGDGSGNAANLKPLTLTAERYEQRTEAFTRILEFVSEGEKEPEGDLLYLLTRQDTSSP